VSGCCRSIDPDCQYGQKERCCVFIFFPSPSLGPLRHTHSHNQGRRRKELARSCRCAGDGPRLNFLRCRFPLPAAEQGAITAPGTCYALPSFKAPTKNPNLKKITTKAPTYLPLPHLVAICQIYVAFKKNLRRPLQKAGTGLALGACVWRVARRPNWPELLSSFQFPAVPRASARAQWVMGSHDSHEEGAFSAEPEPAAGAGDHPRGGLGTGEVRAVRSTKHKHVEHSSRSDYAGASGC
jgi:hypothetical protein